MRKKRVWRYYCEHCKKGGCSAGHIAKHERGCTRNPTRECGVCKRVGFAQQPTEALLAALLEFGVEGVKALALGCPACVMAAIHAMRRNDPLQFEPETGYNNYVAYDYATEARAFWSEHEPVEQY